MKIFKIESEARDSLDKKEKRYINSVCPYSASGRLCGSYCALFYFYKGSDKTSSYVTLGCKGIDKQLFVQKII